jgi:hypothetical protein
MVIVFIDPVSKYMEGVNTDKNSDVRSALAPLSRIAEKHDVAIVNATHFNKAGFGPAIYRAMGRIGFTAQSRIAWVCIRNYEDEDRVLWLQLKNNTRKRMPGLTYRIEDSKVEWEEGPVNMSADETMREPKGPPPVKLEAAVEWLRKRLSQGCVESKQLEKEAKSQASISRKTFFRARKRLKARAAKDPNQHGIWYVSLPDIQLREPGDETEAF